jgi:tetratricopeptide (TPR) repeat protein
VTSEFVFISYHRGDSDYVARLVDHLRGAGLEVWRDTERIRYGDRWEQVTRDEVARCAALVVVMSPAAEASLHVGNELSLARELGKPILPVWLSGDRHFALGGLHSFDAREGGLPDDRFLDRLTALTATAGPAMTVAEPGQVVIGDPPGEAVAWQDRPYLLEEVVAAADEGRATVVSALAGQRGVGKTQLAAAYARLRIQHGWSVVVWVNAESEAGVIAALDELAAAAGVREPEADPQAAARAALRWLRTRPGQCLLVYDNAVDADVVREWTPAFGKVHTVVTTTNRELDSLGSLIDVTLFTPGEAVGYLARRTGLDDKAGAGVVTELLGRLPLALAQAGAVIGSGRRYPGYRHYAQAVDRVDTGRLLPRIKGDPYPHGLAEAVLLSLDDLERADLGSRARRMLDLLAVLGPAGGDRILLRHLAADAQALPDPLESDPDESADADAVVAVLTGRSLTVPADDTDHVVVHRLIQRVVRETLSKAGTLDAVTIRAADAVRAAADEASRQWRDRALIVEYSTHAQVLLTHTVEDTARRLVLNLQTWMLYWLNSASSFTTSIAIGRQLITALERVYGADHPNTMNSRNSLANAYRSAGRVDEAIELDTRTLADRERVQGTDHPDTMNSRNNLADAYREAGRVDEAIELHIRTLTDQERVQGTDHPDTLYSRDSLANAYREAGRVDEAIELHTRALTGRERVLGTDHRDTLTSGNNLANAYRTAGRLDEAIDLYTRTLADQERVLGTDHPHALTSRNNLADAYRDAGRVDEAIKLHTRTLTDRERVLGTDHPDTLASRNNLANAYRTAGRLDEAIDLYTRTLADQERVLGTDHPHTLASRNNLANAYEAAGQVDEA